jgi:hypothetical protein
LAQKLDFKFIHLFAALQIISAEKHDNEKEHSPEDNTVSTMISAKAKS